MKVYISGKITGLPIDEAKYKFAKAEESVREFGGIPINPMEKVPYNEDWTWKDYMIADINLLMCCDAIYMLNNWQDSKGAKLEFIIATELGLNVYFERKI